MEDVPADCDYGYIYVSVKYRVNSTIQNSIFFFKYDRNNPGELVSVQLSHSLLNILESSKQKARQMNTKYYTPFPLLALLESSNEVAEYFNQVREGLAEEFIGKLKNYIDNTLTKSAKKEKFKDFTWEEIEIVRVAFIYAQQDNSLEISEKHLLLGILEDSKSQTIEQMKFYFANNNLIFNLLINNVRTTSTELSNQLDTPDTEEIFSEPLDTSDNNLDTPDADKIF
jgi:ATP-dependent Clp protease ATP-binding subunit ClpA